MHAAMHANSSSSFAHIERKHKRSFAASRNDCGISPSSRRFGVLPRFSFDKVETHGTRQQVETPFHGHIGGHWMCTLRTIAKLGAYSQFNCINRWRHVCFNNQIRDNTQIYKIERVQRARGNHLPVYESIKFAFEDGLSLVRQDREERVSVFVRGITSESLWDYTKLLESPSLGLFRVLKVHTINSYKSR